MQLCDPPTPPSYLLEGRSEAKIWGGIISSDSCLKVIFLKSWIRIMNSVVKTECLKILREKLVTIKSTNNKHIVPGSERLSNLLKATQPVRGTGCLGAQPVLSTSLSRPRVCRKKAETGEGC